MTEQANSKRSGPNGSAGERARTFQSHQLRLIHEGRQAAWTRDRAHDAASTAAVQLSGRRCLRRLFLCIVRLLLKWQKPCGKQICARSVITGRRVSRSAGQGKKVCARPRMQPRGRRARTPEVRRKQSRRARRGGSHVSIYPRGWGQAPSGHLLPSTCVRPSTPRSRRPEH